MLVSIMIPCIPPSGNHYKIPVWSRRRFVVTSQAMKFMYDLGLCARGQECLSDALECRINVFLGKGDRLDADNSAKCVLDGLQHAGVIKNDSRIKRLIVEIGRDWDNPRTEIQVSPL